MKKLITICWCAAGLFMKRKNDMKKIIVIAFLVFAAASYGAQSFGPYTITRTLPSPPGNIGDIEFAQNSLYSLENYNGNIHKIDPVSGNILANFSVPGDSLHDDLPYDGPTGLAYDGTNFWMTTYTPDYLRKLTLGSPPNVTVNNIYSLSNSPQDLTYANGFLYYPAYSGPICEVNPSTGSVIATIPSPSPYIYGLTFDGQNLLAGYGPSGTGSGKIWVISPGNGTILDTWDTGLDGILGMAYDQSTRTLYIGGGFGIAVAEIPEPATICLFAFAGLMLRRKK
jgi:hypothetical protein